jgi:hypothetical protein
MDGLSRGRLSMDGLSRGWVSRDRLSSSGLRKGRLGGYSCTTCTHAGSRFFDFQIKYEIEIFG